MAILQALERVDKVSMAATLRTGGMAFVFFQDEGSHRFRNELDIYES